MRGDANGSPPACARTACGRRRDQRHVDLARAPGAAPGRGRIARGRRSPWSGITARASDGHAQGRAPAISRASPARAGLGRPARRARPPRRVELRVHVRARGRARAPRAGARRREPRQVAREALRRRGDSRPVTSVLDDVARAAGVHGGDRHAERGGLDEHAAQRLRPVRGKHEQRRRARIQRQHLVAVAATRARRTSTPERARLGFERAAHAGRRRRRRAARSRPAPRQAPAAGTARPCWSRACRRRSRTGSGHRAGPPPCDRVERRHVHRVRDDLERACPPAPARALRRSRAIAELTAMTASARAERRALARAGCARMYGISGQRQRPTRAGARPHARASCRRPSTPGTARPCAGRG